MDIKGTAAAAAGSVFQGLTWLRRDAYRAFVHFGKRIGWWKLSAVGGVVLGIVGTLLLSGGSLPLPDVTQGPRTVSVRSVAELAGEAAPLPVVGIVKSQSEAEVRSESAGQIVRLTKELGDAVRAGEVIAEMDNARERAAVLQSEGVADAARAALTKVSRGVREEQVDILSSGVASAETSLAAARTSAVNALLSAYSTVDESVRRKADPMFLNPDSSAPTLSVQSTDSQASLDAENARVHLGFTLEREAALSSTLSAQDDLEAELSRTEAELRDVRTFFDRLIFALNRAVANQAISDTTIATYKSDANAARASVGSALTALSGARDSLASKRAAVDVARKNLEQGVVSDESDIASAEASLKQAQGAYAAARANLEKTIIRAPISGTINSLPVERGDFVSAFTPVATVANNNALEVIAYVTENDTREIVAGGVARIEGEHEGVITRVAPAIDPATRKIEVRIGLTEDAPFVNGQAVTVELARVHTNQTATTPSSITIPIAALKVGTDATVVFTVDENKTLIDHEVTLGTLLGDRVTIAEGLTGDMHIVLDARGLKAGDQVTLK